ncbi:hypothetical protein CK934_25825 [Chitinophaga sp. MD30]|nr:hypothetical protein CK934_25825 [Chitinophaga sp. MD30]
MLTVGKTRMENSTAFLYLQGGKVGLKGEGPLLKDAVLEGKDPFVKDENEYHQQLKIATAGADVLYKKYNDAYMKKDTALLNQMKPAIEQMQEKNKAFNEEWVKTHPASPIATFILATSLKYEMSPEQLEQALGKLQKTATRNKLYERMQQSVNIAKRTAVGQQAPDFKQADTSGNIIALSSFKGKYVLVDFWASWCGPCRRENPSVVKAFQDYKDKNFTVLGVSLDQPGKKEAWLKAIHDDGLTWTHVSDLQFWNNAVAKQYDIQSIPANYLLDPSGKIVARNLHGEELANKLKELIQ